MDEILPTGDAPRHAVRKAAQNRAQLEGQQEQKSRQSWKL